MSNYLQLPTSNRSNTELGQKSSITNELPLDFPLYHLHCCDKTKSLFQTISSASHAKYFITITLNILIHSDFAGENVIQHLEEK